MSSHCQQILSVWRTGGHHSGCLMTLICPHECWQHGAACRDVSGRLVERILCRTCGWVEYAMAFDAVGYTAYFWIMQKILGSLPDYVEFNQTQDTKFKSAGVVGLEL